MWALRCSELFHKEETVEYYPGRSHSSSPQKPCLIQHPSLKERWCLVFILHVNVTVYSNYSYICKNCLCHFVYAVFYLSKYLMEAPKRQNELKQWILSYLSDELKFNRGTWLCFYNIHTDVFSLRASLLHFLVCFAVFKAAFLGHLEAVEQAVNTTLTNHHLIKLLWWMF